MEHSDTQPPDSIDKEMLDLICNCCRLTAFCADFALCCPLQRIRELGHRARVPDTELLEALSEARQFLKEDR